jgi:hypothetical protein
MLESLFIFQNAHQTVIMSEVLMKLSRLSVDGSLRKEPKFIYAM